MKINQNTPNQQNEGKKYIIISNDAESTLDEIQHPYMIKTFHKLVIVGKYLKKIKAIYEKLE